MELFTFVQMEGHRKDLSVVELSLGVREKLSRFDASKARCFLSKVRLHASWSIDARALCTSRRSPRPRTPDSSPHSPSRS